MDTTIHRIKKIEVENKITDVVNGVMEYSFRKITITTERNEILELRLFADDSKYLNLIRVKGGN